MAGEDWVERAGGSGRRGLLIIEGAGRCREKAMRRQESVVEVEVRVPRPDPSILKSV
jgi:hypothetical protein